MNAAQRRRFRRSIHRSIVGKTLWAWKYPLNSPLLVVDAHRGGSCFWVLSQAEGRNDGRRWLCERWAFSKWREVKREALRAAA